MRERMAKIFQMRDPRVKILGMSLKIGRQRAAYNLAFLPEPDLNVWDWLPIILHQLFLTDPYPSEKKYGF
jgi:hypothetical protein